MMKRIDFRYFDMFFDRKDFFKTYQPTDSMLINIFEEDILDKTYSLFSKIDYNFKNGKTYSIVPTFKDVSNFGKLIWFHPNYVKTRMVQGTVLKAVVTIKTAKYELKLNGQHYYKFETSKNVFRMVHKSNRVLDGFGASRLELVFTDDILLQYYEKNKKYWEPCNI